jgi:hypothetical protein
MTTVGRAIGSTLARPTPTSKCSCRTPFLTRQSEATGATARSRHTLTNAVKRRYPWWAMTSPPNPDERDDPSLDRLYDLAERVASEVFAIRPDWCRVARDARELAGAAQRRCCQE